MTTNPFLSGNFAPVREEQTITQLKVTGKIPEHLNGRYLRNGPNPVAEANPDTYTWIMGDPMVHGVRIHDGKAEWYRNRWVRSPTVSRALGEQSRPVPLRTGMDSLGANTNVIGHAGRTLALIEGGYAQYELSSELGTVGPWDFQGTITGGYTAHPLRDPATGELHAVSYFAGRGNKVQYSVIGTNGLARRTVDIEVSGSPMMHAFSLTEKYVVIYDLPVTFDAACAAERMAPRGLRLPARLALSALIGRVPLPQAAWGLARRYPAANARMPYRWNSRYPARIGVMPREGGNADVRWFEVEPCHVFHPLNAYDEGNTVVLDVVRYPKIFDEVRRDPVEAPSALDRWVVDLGTGKVSLTCLDDRSQEFPRMDERRIGRPYRYGYVPACNVETLTAQALLKHDVIAGTTTVRGFGGKLISEFVFEPNSPDAAEDDGVLIGFVTDPSTARTDLTFLDAASLEQIGAIHLPVRVPHGFHGNWIPAG